MNRVVGTQGCGREVVNTVTTGDSGHRAGNKDERDRRIGALPVTEISDEDYRSFCWPCYALEENEDCESGA